MYKIRNLINARCSGWSMADGKIGFNWIWMGCLHSGERRNWNTVKGDPRPQRTPRAFRLKMMVNVPPFRFCFTQYRPFSETAANVLNIWILFWLANYISKQLSLKNAVVFQFMFNQLCSSKMSEKLQWNDLHENIKNAFGNLWQLMQGR